MIEATDLLNDLLTLSRFRSNMSSISSTPGAPNPATVLTRLGQELALKSGNLAIQLCSKRHYLRGNKAENGKVTVNFDPRFLVFEFAENLLLRESQITLIDQFITAFKQNRSICHQMIMGAGKVFLIDNLRSDKTDNAFCHATYSKFTEQFLQYCFLIYPLSSAHMCLSVCVDNCGWSITCFITW